jgi:tetratricopeptide (TPR) repeat protein
MSSLDIRSYGITLRLMGTVIQFPAPKPRPITPFPTSEGQRALDFVASRPAKVIVLRPTVNITRAYDLYAKASQLDTDPFTYDEAEKLYREAIRLDPLLFIAHTNLGNILFRRGNMQGALALYEQAVAGDDRQPEAHYNLGYVLLDMGRHRDASEAFRRALARDSRFADAAFNLATALELMGMNEARDWWKRYLELEPHGTWADVARQHLNKQWRAPKSVPNTPKPRHKRVRLPLTSLQRQVLNALLDGNWKPQGTIQATVSAGDSVFRLLAKQRLIERRAARGKMYGIDEPTRVRISDEGRTALQLGAYLNVDAVKP